VSALDPSFLLFVPGDRPDRFAKALRSGASGAILDLEDGVALDRKQHARSAVAAFLDAGAANVTVRVNGARTQWFEDDVAMLRERSVAGVVIPKAESRASLDALESALGPIAVIALIESARGVLAAGAIAEHPRCVALAFGPYDLSADLGGTADWDAMLPHRAAMLIAARAFGRIAIDGPSTALHDAARIGAEAQQAARLGYDGKLLVHPDQIAPVHAAFRPSRSEVERARRLLEAAEQAMPTVVDGAMVDEPMLAAARRTLERARRAGID
jgi:citrate lyase subunit beta/citryl-CoA lyase